ncbi:MAG TPA: oligosaccharide flippase family protein [Candidatus Eisenbacteria bacterium]|nr:oligosaccharide flippase family protein [Candidatus Eisenbacteria bacterium]
MWRKLLRNALSNVTGTAIGLAVGFVTMPLVVHHLGPTQFGLWVLATGVVGYVGVLDLGLAPTLVNEAAALLAHDDAETHTRLDETTSTIYAVYAGLGLLAALGLAVVALGASRLFQVAPDDLATFRIVLLVVGVQTALGLPMSVWNGLLSGLQAFHVLNAIGVATTVARGALTIALVLTGHGLVALVGSSFAVTLAGWLAARACVHRRIAGLRVRLTGFRRARLREIGRFSIAMIVWTAAGATLHQLDRILIGIVLPVASLTTYEIGARLANYSRALLHSWLGIVMPATSALAARGERGRLRSLYLRTTRYLMTTYAGVVVLLLGFGGPLVRLWMGPGFEEGYVVMSLLLVGSLVQSQNVVAHVMLPGVGELRIFTIFMAIYPVVTAACAVTGILTAGLTGLAAGTATAMLVMESVFLVVVRRRLGVSLRRVLARCHWPVAKATLPAALWIVLLRLVTPVESWLALAVTGAVAGLVFLSAAWTGTLTPAERRAVSSALGERWRAATRAELPGEASC